MSSAAEQSLDAQRQELRARLQAQRRVIAEQLGNGSHALGKFPRSITMRLLTQRPQLIIKVLGSLVSLLRLR
ncbi:MAG TPA: hypothetical protein VF931_03240 [Steroidobacteraceae bacterium]